MSELHSVGEPRAAAAADLIFVHGLGGDPFATWWHNVDKPKDSLPFWLAEDLPHVAVHCLAYDASPSKWLGSSMPLIDRATNVLTRFEAEGVGGRPLFFVCHSLGGLVVKQTLRSALELGESSWREIVDNTRGIIFLATPHTGARLADYLGALGKILRLSVTIGELEASAPALRDLNVWYRQKAKDLGIDTLAMFETRDTHGVRVVDESSADAGHGIPRAIDADHFSICKPQFKSELVHAAIRSFVTRRLPAKSSISQLDPKGTRWLPSQAGSQLGSPGGIVKLNSKFYIRRPADDLIETAAQLTGETLVIKGPSQFGKSSLLFRYLAACRAAGKRDAYLNFQSFTEDEVEDYSTLLTRMARYLLRTFRLGSTEKLAIKTNHELSNFVEDEIVSKLDLPITIVFDEAGRILGRPYQNDFFSMLRLWHNSRAFSPWERVDLALALATDPYLLIDSKDRSPFNVATPIELQPFDRASLDYLNDSYGGPLNANELDGLHQLLDGYPYLTQLAFYLLKTGQIRSFDELDRRAGDPDGPFKQHFGEIIVLLQQREGLLAAMRQVVAKGCVPSDEAYYRLHGAGLVKRESRVVRASNLLYERFFAEVR